MKPYVPMEAVDTTNKGLYQNTPAASGGILILVATDSWVPVPDILDMDSRLEFHRHMWCQIYANSPRRRVTGMVPGETGVWVHNGSRLVT